MRARMRGRAGVTLEATEEEVGKLKLALTKYSGFPKVYQVTRRCLYQAFTLIPMAIKCVYPTGCGSGKGTHVSIYTFTMKGSYDDHLKWPFRGVVIYHPDSEPGWRSRPH